MSEDTSRQVRFYLDLVSPYTYFALMRAHEFSRVNRVEWQLRPVVYGALLDATGLIGPVEAPTKRRYTHRDILRIALLSGVPLVGPPKHPFRSLEALRTLCLFRHDQRALELAARLAEACWGDGRPLTDLAVIEEVVVGLGLDAAGLGERIGEEAVKRDLHDLTLEALERGIFGVPSFEYEGDIFWGHDRLDHLAARLTGELADLGPELDEMERRPSGATRKDAPDPQ